MSEPVLPDFDGVFFICPMLCPTLTAGQNVRRWLCFVYYSKVKQVYWRRDTDAKGHLWWLCLVYYSSVVEWLSCGTYADAKGHMWCLCFVYYHKMNTLSWRRCQEEFVSILWINFTKCQTLMKNVRRYPSERLTFCQTFEKKFRQHCWAISVYGLRLQIPLPCCARICTLHSAPPIALTLY